MRPCGLCDSPLRFLAVHLQAAEKNDPFASNPRSSGLTILVGTKHTRHDEAQRITIQCLLICEITIENAAD